jgi:NAD(P)-dependent dehydrogenase (short-subunit alcohol dehydrogenase family)
VDVQGKVVVVTGGGNGIGRAVVLELLRRGARVAAVDLRKDSLDDTAAIASAGDRLALFALDITDRDAVTALPEQVVANFGVVDVLVNVAGIIQPFVRLNDLGFDAIERVMDVNFYGTLNTVKAFLPHLLQRPVGHVANVSSMGGFLPVPGQTAYGASKAAVKLLTEGLYAELQDTNIGVSVVLPGAVGTDITQHSGVEVPASAAESASSYRTTSPQEAGRIIVDGIEKGRLYVFVGRDARAMDVLRRVAPRRATRFIAGRMRDLLDR